MRLSKQLFQDRLTVPDNWRDLDTYKLFEECGFVEFPYSGFPLFLPIGKRVMESICGIIRKEAETSGFNEVYLPLVQSRSFLESTGRADLFGNEFMELKDGLDGYILSPTNEEIFLDLAQRGLSSYRQLPVKIYQIAEKFRNIKKAKGILRSRQFLMCDMVSMDETEQSLRESASLFERLVDSVFSRMKLSPLRVEKNDGKYVDYLIQCKEGETSISVDSEGKAHYAGDDDRGITKGSSVAMYFIFEQIGSQNPTYQSDRGTRKEIYLGTYGFGIQRCFHAAVEIYKDHLGINFPDSIRPFDVSIVVMNPDDGEQMARSINYYNSLSGDGRKVMLDDRHGKTLKEKAEFADFYGVPVKLVIGRKEIETGSVTIKKRGDRQGELINFNQQSVGVYING
ncbi:MAG TPA: aminoacyl--tRNA ligase-related protein [Candidatus Nanoarchaeia archaeon]|nr:aminoacyl--tRNA ligase-related protein [Candidatus Nanoarchaeia archaeon]